MKRVITLLVIAITFLVAQACDRPMRGSVLLKQTLSQDVAPLAEAATSAIVIGFSHFKAGGTGVIVGRKKINDSLWQYHVLTACHVISALNKAVPDGVTPEKFFEMDVLTQESFHSMPVMHKSKLDEIEFALIGADFAIISLKLPIKLPCATLATKEEFEAIQPFETVYGVGSNDMRGLLYKDGILASTNNIWPYDKTSYGRPWTRNPELFFRVEHKIWFGASGGPIFNKSGKVIGIYNGMQTETDVMAICLKSHVILYIVGNSEVLRKED